MVAHSLPRRITYTRSDLMSTFKAAGWKSVHTEKLYSPSRLGSYDLVVRISDTQRTQRPRQMLDPYPTRVPTVPSGCGSTTVGTTAASATRRRSCRPKGPAVVTGAPAATTGTCAAAAIIAQRGGWLAGRHCAAMTHDGRGTFG